MMHRINSGERFDVEFVSADRRRGTGGALKVYRNCMISRRSGGNKKAAGGVQQGSSRRNNYRNGTITVRLLGRNEIKDIHVRLITLFNGATVL